MRPDVLAAPAAAIAIAALFGCTTGQRAIPAGTQSVDARAPLGLEQYLAAEPDAPDVTRKVALGRRLFFDSILSADLRTRCASCHRPDRAFTDGRPKSIGVFGRAGHRSVPSILNAGYGRRFFWDGRDSVLEQQVLMPVINPNELGMTMNDVLSRLSALPAYRREFDRLFDDGVTSRNVGRALASYVRTLRAADAPFDRFANGDSTAMTAPARQGYRLFIGRAGCARCHAGPLFTDEDFHNTGVSWGGTDTGRSLATSAASDRGRFNTPSLRNVAHTAPYMHDGSLASLEDVVRFYNQGAQPNPNLDPLIRPLQLSDAEREDLVAFLRALSSTAWPERSTQRPANQRSRPAA